MKVYFERPEWIVNTENNEVYPDFFWKQLQILGSTEFGCPT